MTLHAQPATPTRRTPDTRPQREIERERLALLFQDCVERYGEKTALRYRAGGRWHGVSWNEQKVTRGGETYVVGSGYFVER